MNTITLPATSARPFDWRRGLRVAVAQLHTWRSRAEQRRQLAACEPWQLRDMGITPEMAATEAAKPFWQA
jgi:uncharacterized protein YjiS (DUF1127 family)